MSVHILFKLSVVLYIGGGGSSGVQSSPGGVNSYLREESNGSTASDVIDAQGAISKLRFYIIS